jgi:selenocysteine lyase/cysteine desulfurase
MDCDYLVCSGYKIFAPHMGFLWGKRKALEALPTFREDFIPDMVPTKMEVGTFVYENVAGMDAAIGYLETLGARVSKNGRPTSRRAMLVSAMEAIRSYEATLSFRLLAGLAGMKSNPVTVYGIQDSEHLHLRVPTICFNLYGVSPAKVATELAQRSIGVRDGNMYSPRLLTRLSIAPETGAVRASLAHYNCFEEVDRFLIALHEIAGD